MQTQDRLKSLEITINELLFNIAALYAELAKNGHVKLDAGKISLIAKHGCNRWENKT